MIKQHLYKQTETVRAPVATRWILHTYERVGLVDGQPALHAFTLLYNKYGAFLHRTPTYGYSIHLHSSYGYGQCT